MATNYFKPFNTNKLNMQTDAEYNTETQRLNGVTGIAKSIMHNKLFRQVSVMAYAIGEFIKGTGYDASDADEAALVTALSNAVATKASVDAKSMFENAGGTGTAITLGTAQQIDKYSTTFIASANNGGVATTVNSRPLYKPGTASSPTLIAGKAYTIWYNLSGTCFFVKASAEGTAVVGDVLAGKTFSNDTDTALTGTIPSKTAQTYNPSTSVQTINSGQYLSGAQTISPVTGNSTVEHVLAGDIFSSENGINLTGSMVRRTGALYPGYEASVGFFPSSQRLHVYFPKGAYIDNRTDSEFTGISNVYPGVYVDDTNFLASNILSGVSIFGVTGTAATGKNFASGTFTSRNATINCYTNTGVTGNYSFKPISELGLSFTPRVIVYFYNNSFNATSNSNINLYLRDGFTWSGFYSFCMINNAMWTNDITGSSTGIGRNNLLCVGQNATYGFIAYE